MTSMTSGSPSAMSSALARRLSKRWRCTWASRICGLVVGVGHGGAQLGVQSLGVGDGAAQLGVQSADLLVGRRCWRSPKTTSTKASGNMSAMRMPDRNEVGIDARGQGLARHHAGDEDQREGAEGDDGADQAEAGRPRDLSGPFLLGNHVPLPLCRRPFSAVASSLPLPSSTRRAEAPHGARRPFGCRLTGTRSFRDSGTPVPKVDGSPRTPKTSRPVLHTDKNALDWLRAQGDHETPAHHGHRPPQCGHGALRRTWFRGNLRTRHLRPGRVDEGCLLFQLRQQGRSVPGPPATQLGPARANDPSGHGRQCPHRRR